MTDEDRKNLVSILRGQLSYAEQYKQEKAEEVETKTILLEEAKKKLVDLTETVSRFERLIAELNG